MIVTFVEMKDYLHIDYDDDDRLIQYLIEGAQKMCMGIMRTEDTEELEANPNAKIAVMYAVGYLYEHREEADHHALTITLRSLLFGCRKEAF